MTDSRRKGHKSQTPIKATSVVTKSKVLSADIAIIGAGAAGLAAAISACRNSDAKVVLIEKNSEAGKKIRATGNGRCNVSNEQADGKDEVIEFLASAGVYAKAIGEAGLMYPISESAADVAEALIDKAISFGCEMMADSEVSSIDKEEKFVIKGRSNGAFFTVNADKVIAAAGGKAGPVYGTTGDAYKWMGLLGHEVVRPIPVLAPIECDGDKCEQIAGIRAKGEVTLYCRGEKSFSEAGEIQFTKYGISGICVFNATRHMRFDREEGISIFEIGVNLFPGMDVREILERRVAEEREASKTSGYVAPKAASILRTLVKDKLASYVLDRAGVSPAKNISALSDADVAKIVNTMTDLRFHPTGVKGWKEAQCTSGGVKLDEVSADTYESKIVPGLYITGELLDYDGPCGGYNLNHAILSGKRAGEDAVRGN